MQTKDPSFLKQVRELPCLACGTTLDVEAHHVKTKGSGGGDDPWNVIPLCTNHHTAEDFSWHRNLKKFFRKFPWVWTHLMRELGWQYTYVHDVLTLIHPAYRDQAAKSQPKFKIGV